MPAHASRLDLTPSESRDAMTTALMHYYQAIEKASQDMLEAARAGNLELKGRAIGRAVRIVDEGLSAPLNLEKGGTMATDLRDLYTYITLRLTHANLRNDEAALEECTRLIEPLRSAWASIADQAA